MSNVVHDYEQLQGGINKLLGKESYGKPEVVKECTEHQSDGFIYDEEPNPVETILRCKVCGMHYTVASATINFNTI